MADNIVQIKAEREALATELAELKDKYRKLEEAHARLQTSHVEYESKLSQQGVKIKKEYVYRDDECRPVPIGGVCPICAWDRNTQRKPGDKNREPHPV